MNVLLVYCIAWFVFVEFVATSFLIVAIDIWRQASGLPAAFVFVPLLILAVNIPLHIVVAKELKNRVNKTGRHAKPEEK